MWQCQHMKDPEQTGHAINKVPIEMVEPIKVENDVRGCYYCDKETLIRKVSNRLVEG